jgi:hypothetical protein
VTQQLRAETIARFHPAAARELSAALDLLADALADRCIDRARREVAAELGLDERAIDRERGRGALDAGPILPFAVPGDEP